MDVAVDTLKPAIQMRLIMCDCRCECSSLSLLPLLDFWSAGVVLVVSLGV